MNLLTKNISSRRSINLAPMIDFLFLMLTFFASLAVSRITTLDTEIDLVEINTSQDAVSVVAEEEIKIIRLSITKDHQYKWITEIRDYPMESPKQIAAELRRQHEKGLLPPNKENTHVLIRIDKSVAWEGILKLLLAIEEEGFNPRPVYELKEE